MIVGSALEHSPIKKRCRIKKCHREIDVYPSDKTVKCACGELYGITRPLTENSKGNFGGIKLTFIRNYRTYRSDSEILECIKNLGQPHQRRIADKIGMNPTTLGLRLNRLIKEGKIEIVSQRPGKKTIYRVIDCL